MIIVRDIDAPQGLNPDLAITFFGDESSQQGHRFLVLGVLAILHRDVADLESRLATIRQERHITGEIGWTCHNNYNKTCYSDWIDEFAKFARRGAVRLSVLVLDTRMPTNRGWDTKNFDLGFNKLIYQLLLHRVGKKYGNRACPIHGYLDKRNTSHKPDEMRRMLNGGLRKLDIKCNPFRSIHFRDSRDSDVIQLVDVLIGGLAFDRNEHALKPNARQAKIEMSGKICALELRGLRFDVWNFVYKSKSP